MRLVCCQLRSGAFICPNGLSTFLLLLFELALKDVRLVCLEHVQNGQRELRPSLSWNVQTVLHDDLLGKASNLVHPLCWQSEALLAVIHLIEDCDLRDLMS